MFYTIYKTTNLINGKFYIGKHQTKDLNDGYIGSGKLLKRAIKKYGVEHFHKEILYVCESEKQMNALEKILVVPDPELNYNLCDGGKGGFSYLNRTGKNVSENQKAAVRKLVVKIAPLGGKASQKTLKERKLAIYNREINGFLGKKHTKEWKEKHSSLMQNLSKGNKNSQFGTCWITNGVENKKIKKEELDFYLQSGYYKGRIMGL